jgi:uncharacterized protein
VAATDRAEGARARRGRASGARWWGRVALALGGLVLGCALWAFWLEPRRLVFRELSLDVPRWPAELGDLRLALMSDLHVGSPYWDLERLERLVADTNRRRPDLVLLAGDYLINGVKFGSWVDPESIARALGALRAPLGIVAVLGNHDWWNGGARVRRALESQGIVVLENQAHAFLHAGREFYVVGVGDPQTEHAAVAEALGQVPATEPFLVLVHGPDVFPAIDDRASLTLAGHTHGGQVCLPWIGCPIVPSSYGQRFVSGHVVEGGRHLFVTSGVGTSIFPVRFGVPPEVVFLTLH